ncbi:MAG: PilN domain-containing protein [Thiohalophilus sp.]|jgi:Tfp pilus assembly protein PilN
MSLKLSFVSCETDAVPGLFVGAWVLLLSLLIFAAGMIVTRFELSAQNLDLADRQVELKNKLEQQSELLKGGPSLSEFRQLQQRIAAINELAGRQGAGLSVMLSRIEELLPDQAYVTSLSYKPADNELLLTIEAPGAEQLTGLLQAAEKSGRFSEVQLSRQSQEKRGNRRVIQFEIRLRAAGGRA